MKLITRDENKARKGVSFNIDYEDILIELFRVVKNNKYLVFTVGIRKVDNEVVLSLFSYDLAHLYEQILNISSQ